MSDNKHGKSGQYVYSMNRVSKVVPPKREILKDISLSFFPGAKIGVLGLNGSGKSTLLKIMAGIDTDIQGEARPQAGIKIGYLAQEPQLNTDKDVRAGFELTIILGKYPFHFSGTLTPVILTLDRINLYCASVNVVPSSSNKQ